VTAADGTEILLAAVSDGAGTAPESDVGAAIAVDLFLERMGAFCGANPLDSIDVAVVSELFQELVDAIRHRAKEDAQPIGHYACTFLGAVVGTQGAAYVQLGDGAIVVSTVDGAPSEMSWIFWPQHGEYANSTYFVTQEGVERLLQFETGPPVDEIALFTDGIERLVLDMTNHTVHGPAFRPIFDWLATTLPGHSEHTSPVLTAYLASDHINRRTDDDKSLVMATRVKFSPPEPTGESDPAHAAD